MFIVLYTYMYLLSVTLRDGVSCCSLQPLNHPLKMTIFPQASHGIIIIIKHDVPATICQLNHHHNVNDKINE